MTDPAWTTLAKARKLFHEAASNCALPMAQTVPLADSHRRVLAKDVHAHYDLPSQTVSAMDGYAVRGSDIRPNRPFTLVGKTQAGDEVWPHPLKENQAVRVFTGAPVPPGADTILLQEWCEQTAQGIVTSQVGTPNQFLRHKGSDFTSGTCLLKHGQSIDGRKLQVLASAGLQSVNVYPRHRVSLIATGNELVMPGTSNTRHQTFASSLFGLQALLKEQWAVATNCHLIRDDATQLEDKIHQAHAESDLIITLGGASAGNYDLIRDLWPAVDGEILVRAIAMIPGKPTWIVRWKEKLCLCLPGNPISMYVAASLLLPCYFDGLYRRHHTSFMTFPALTCNALPENGAREAFLRAKLDDLGDGSLPRVKVYKKQESHHQHLFAEANCLTHRMPFAPALNAGAKVSVLLLDHPLTNSYA